MSNDLLAPLDVKLMNLTSQALLLGFVLLVLGAGGRWLVQQPMFAIRGITVLGDISHTNALVLRTQAAPQLKGTFFTLDLGAAQRAFESVPWVRKAIVQREFPNRLRVLLQEHQAVAYWGDEANSTLVNSYGEVFEANLGEIEQDALPRLDGPPEKSAQILAMYRALTPLLQAQNLTVDELTLSRRGNWQLQLDGGAMLELGGGDADEVMARLQRFLGTVGQVAARHGRNLSALEAADLRYGQGYALRLRGVSTLAPHSPGKKS